MKEIPITSIVGFEVTSTASLFGATVEGFPTPSLPKNAGKTDYAEIKEVHQLLETNTALVKSNLSVGQNVYLGIIITS